MRGFKPVLAMIMALSMSVPLLAEAQIIVGGNSHARDCYRGALSDEDGRRKSIKTCERALSEDHLGKIDRAATHVNLGILLMRRGDYPASLTAYDGALAINPDLAEAYINRGACLIFLSRPDDAITALTKSIELNTDHLPDALFNRAIAYERLGQTTAAYKDFRRAQDLRPDWDLPARALESYQVVTRKG